MQKSMKVLVAFDGSTGAETAIYDLQRAGLPDAVEAHVLSVADVWMLPQDESHAPSPLGQSATMREARASATAMLKQAEAHATQGAKLLRRHFPHWQITSETAASAPAWAITLKAEEWGADLIVVGSHGYAPIQRWVLGSVSQAVLTHARCSVRIARSRPTAPDRPLRILVGIDGSSEADLAVRTVASRQWPKGTDIRLMTVVPREPATADDADTFDDTLGRKLDSYVDLIKEHPIGVTASKFMAAGDPKRVLVDVAEEWGADCIFIGSRGLNQWERLLLGSVSASVAARATCTVEVLRAPTKL